jgi:hypothetical protein
MAPDISESIPAPLTGGGLRGQAFATDPRFDVLVNGMAFCLRPSDAHPYQRAGAQVRKQQIDTSNEAGEQTLGDAWIRSQTSWHFGSGITWYDKGTDSTIQYRFAKSQGVNVWTEGQLTLLHSMTSGSSGLDANTTLSTFRRGGVDGFAVVSNNAVSWRDSTGASVISATLGGSSGTQPAPVGGAMFVGRNGGVDKWDTAGTGTLTSPITCTGVARAWWVKSRLFVAVGPSVYWCAASYTGAITAANLVYTHPDSDWVYTDVAETGDAVLLAGYSGSESAIYAATLNSTLVGGLPALDGARQVSKMPTNEQITAMGSYLAAFVVLGTTKGVRVGTIGSGGSVKYSGLVVSTPAAVTDVTFADRFAYATGTAIMPDGKSGAIRIDMSAPLDDSDAPLYAYANDVYTSSTAAVSSVALIGNTSRVVLAAGGTLFLESATALVAEGWVESGRLRYGTAELKDFQRMRVNGALNNGHMTVTAITPSGEYRLITYGPTTGVEGEASISVPGSVLNEWIAVRVYLDASGTNSPTVTGLSVKAIPAVAKTRMIRFPLSCYDFEVLRTGDRQGYRGFATDRLFELEALETAATPVTVNDLRTGENLVGTIDAVEYTSTAPSDRNEPAAGGIVELTIRVR